ncbi:MAG: GAP family protein [Actinophytocola sp.]|uniref:GAP family protein n=1 Tax=Actinophytocola sp. TaxID=1872138 RepID=UPI003C7938B1
MGQTLGDLLPLAVGVAISPIPIIAVILMLLAPKAGGTSAGFLAGWVVGVAAATVVFLLLAGTFDMGSGEPSSTASWIKLVLGVLLLLLAARQWQSRPRAGAEPSAPKWMAAIDRFTAPKAAGLGLLLSAVNPKNLLMCVAAGTTIASGGLSAGQDSWAVVIFTVLATCTVSLPVLAYAVGRKRMARPLESLHTWLAAHNAAVMGTMLLVIGFVLVGKAIGGLV